MTNFQTFLAYMNDKQVEIINMLDRRYCSSMDFAHAKEQFNIEYEELKASLPGNVPPFGDHSDPELVDLVIQHLDVTIANESPFVAAPFFEGFTDSDHFDIVEYLTEQGM